MRLFWLHCIITPAKWSFIGFCLLLLCNIVKEALQRLPTASLTVPKNVVDVRASDAASRLGSFTTFLNTTVRPQILVFLSIVMDVVFIGTLKLLLYVFSIFFFVFSNELKEYNQYVQCPFYKQRPVTGPSPSTVMNEKTIVFIRHGESLWNRAFNRPSKRLAPLRILELFVLELALFCTWDSSLCDSPLSALGESQARSLLNWIQAQEEKGTLQRAEGASESVKPLTLQETPVVSQPDAFPTHAEVSAQHSPSTSFTLSSRRAIVVTSNLRRAVATSVLGLPYPLSQSTKDSNPIYVLSSLQEATRNIDGHAISLMDQIFSKLPRFRRLSQGPRKGRFLSSNGAVLEPSAVATKAVFNHTYNCPAKQSFRESLLSRLIQFADWVFSDSAPSAQVDVIVVVGHSIWLRKFLTLFLPPNAACKEKTVKLPNCGVLKFDLLQYKVPSTDRVDYWIDPNSVKQCFQGFHMTRVAT